MPCSQCGGAGHNIKTCFRVHNDFMGMIDTNVLSTEHVPRPRPRPRLQPRPQPRPQPSPRASNDLIDQLNLIASQLPLGQPNRVHYDRVQSILQGNRLNQWKNAAVRFNYLMNELRKLGAADEERFPMFAAIMDLQQDIDLPTITEEDKHHANVPSVYTGLA